MNGKCPVPWKIPFVLAGVVLWGTVFTAGGQFAHAQQAGSKEGAKTSIHFLSDLPNTLVLASETRKPILLIFAAGWCSSCRTFKSETLPAPEVQSFADRFYWVRIDIDRNLSLARSRNVKGTPRFDLIDPDGITRVLVTGVLTPAEFTHRLEAFLEDLKETPRYPPGASSSTIRADDHTPLTWSPEGYRGLAICFSNVGYGPLALTSQSPFQSLRYGLVPRTPSTLAKGQLEMAWNETWVNIWAKERGEYFLDYEMLHTNVAFRYGATDVVQVDLEYSSRSRFGGILDTLGQGAHDAFGIDQNGRDEISKGQFGFDIAPDETQPGVHLGKGDRGSFAESLLLSVQHNITCGQEYLPALAYAVSVRSEMGNDPDLKGKALDVGVSMAASKRFGDFYAYLALGFTYFGEEEFVGIELRNSQASVLTVIEWRFEATMSLLLQYLLSEGVAEDLGDFSAPSHEVTFGVKWELTRDVVVQFGWIENMITYNNTPDFGYHFGLNVRF